MKFFALWAVQFVIGCVICFTATTPVFWLFVGYVLIGTWECHLIKKHNSARLRRFSKAATKRRWTKV